MKVRVIVANEGKNVFVVNDFRIELDAISLADAIDYCNSKGYEYSIKVSE